MGRDRWLTVLTQDIGWCDQLRNHGLSEVQVGRQARALFNTSESNGALHISITHTLVIYAVHLRCSASSGADSLCAFRIEQYLLLVLEVGCPGKAGMPGSWKRI